MGARQVIGVLAVPVLAIVGAAVGFAVDQDMAWPAGAGAVVGAVLASPLAVRIARRPTIRDGAAARAATGLPLVAHVDHAPSGDRERRAADEAFRMLRASLAGPEGTAPDAEGGAGAHLLAVVVTSAAPGEGKTTVAAGLARALARAGRPVVAVEADLRRPGLAIALGAPTAPRGLTAALVGGVPVAELLLDVEPGLRLLPAGELPPNAPELLAGPDAARVLAELLALDAAIVLDTAPLLPVADTRELLAHGVVRRVVLVARPGVVHEQELRDAAALLPLPSSAVLAVSGAAEVPRSYERYLRDAGA